MDSILAAPNEYGIDAVAGVTLRNNRTGATTHEAVSAVFIFVGSTPETSLVPFVERDDAGYVITSEEMESSSRGLYAVGDVRVTPFRQLVVAAADGAIAAHAAARRVEQLRSTAASEVPLAR